jgi:ceramide glucosyltransferase
MNGLADLMAVLAVIGLAQSVAGWLALRQFRRFSAPAPQLLPPISVLKPLHGDEALLEAALASFCAQQYPAFQIVFGLHNAEDPALAVVHRLQARFPDCDIAVVVDARRHGTNGKISNLINMLPAARHDLLVIADADVHAPADHLLQVVAAMERPGTGLVTSLYSGLAADFGLAARLGASGITHGFLPGALLARALGRQDCLGATMALHRATLERVGGLVALADQLADDNVLGQLVRAQGLAVRLAASIPATTVAEAGLGALLRHELRWARTIRALVPVTFAFSALQYPLAWAILAFVMTAPSLQALALFAAAWAVRAVVAMGIDAALPAHPRATAAPIALLPLRDLLSAGILLASYFGDSVDWRGQRLIAGPMRQMAPIQERDAHAENTVPPASLV